MQKANIFTIVIGTAALLGTTSLASAGNLDIQVSKNSASIDAQLRPEKAEWRAGAGYLYHEGSRHLANIDFHAVGETALGNLPATVAVGVKTNVFDENHFDGGAVMIGGDVRLNLPDVPGLSVETTAHYAPPILSFNDADGMFEFGAQVNYRIIPKADVYVGYQIINADIDPGSHITLDEGGFAGIRIHF